MLREKNKPWYVNFMPFDYNLKSLIYQDFYELCQLYGMEVFLV